MSPDTLSPRYAAGEDPRPLVRALAGGLLGATAALCVDRLVFVPGLGTWSWPALLAGRFLGDRSSTAAGCALLVVVTCAIALLLAYGQVRRFLAGPAWWRGACVGLIAWLMAGPVVLPAYLPVLGAVAEPTMAFGQAALLVAETCMGAVLCGVVIGGLNPPRSGL
jgi:hypothetical protein